MQAPAGEGKGDNYARLATQMAGICGSEGHEAVGAIVVALRLLFAPTLFIAGLF
jgi:hypothetical protein